MSTDPKKNDEIKDEELDKVSGGGEAEQPDEQPDGDPPDTNRPLPPVTKTSERV